MWWKQNRIESGNVCANVLSTLKMYIELCTPVQETMSKVHIKYSWNKKVANVTQRKPSFRNQQNVTSQSTYGNSSWLNCNLFFAEKNFFQLRNILDKSRVWLIYGWFYYNQYITEVSRTWVSDRLFKLAVKHWISEFKLMTCHGMLSITYFFINKTCIQP